MSESVAFAFIAVIAAVVGVGALAQMPVGNLVLGLENTSRRMSRLAKNELYLGEYISLDSLINLIDEVTADNVYDIANRIIQPDKFVSVILQPSKKRRLLSALA